MKCIDGVLFDVLANYPQYKKSIFALKGAESRWYHIKAGVPQDSILGPLMFLIYADDIVEGFECDIHMRTMSSWLQTTDSAASYGIF